MIPANAKITFGPWSPPTKTNNYGGDRESLKGTLRVYQGTKDNIIACFAGVTGFRDLSMQYAEQIAKEEGAVIWKDDKDGYQREEKVKRSEGVGRPSAARRAPAQAPQEVAMSLPHHRLTIREQIERDAMERNRAFAEYLIAAVVGLAIFALIWSVHP